MMNSLFTGISGLRNHLVRMNVIGNNIANVNTVGFKAGRTTFEEVLAQTMEMAGRPNVSSGGTNPIQYGLGMSVSSLDTIFSQGSLEMTGKVTDLAIQGDGFFILSDGANEYYTRAGAFTYDAEGNLVNPSNGFIVQGRMADPTTGEIPSEAAIGNIQLPLEQMSPAKATTLIELARNLDANTPEDGTHKTSITVYDSLGERHTVTVTFTKTANNNEWTWAATATGSSAPTGDRGSITFDGNGLLTEGGFTYDGGASSFSFTPDNGAEPVSITFDVGTRLNGLTQFQSPSTATLENQDGYGMGTLSFISIDNSGVISGVFTNGVTRNLAQIVLADFNNPAGLLKLGENMYQESANSGQAVRGIAGSTINGTISSGYLERSNVDLVQEFTSMIIAQRGFQANARTIITTDDMLGELINLKR